MAITVLRTRETTEPAVGSHRRRWVWPAAFAAAGLVLLAGYLRQARMVPVMSDGASNALQAWDMLHGNLLLHGWTLTDLSFYTIDLPEYMVLERLHGLNPGTAHVAAALTYTLMVIGAAALAKGRARGREGVVRALIAAGIMLAPALGPTTATLISDPDHTATQVPLLIIWMILDRARPRWWVPAAVTVVLAWAQVADPLVAYEGVLPLLVVCAIHLYRRRDLLSARPDQLPVRLAEYLRMFWYPLSLAVGAAFSAGAAALALRLIRQVGGFALTPPDTTFAPVAQLYHHVWVTAESVLVVFGADFSGKQLNVHVAVALVHLAGVTLAGWATVRGLRRFADADLVVRILAVTMLVLLAAYTISGDPNAAGGPHEIVGVLPVGAALAGRLLAGQFVRDRHLALLAVGLACYAAIFAHNVVQQPAQNANSELAAWLRAHDLSYGLATYWNASSVTVDTGGGVEVRPVNRNARGQVAAVKRDSVPSWYDPRRHDARFLVMPGTHLGCSNGTRYQWLSSVNAGFGPPAASYRDAGFLVLVWSGNLLEHVAKPIMAGAC